MTKKSETIIFFGSGPVAAKSLRLLLETFDIEAVITKPRPEHHKGSVPVLELAEELNIPVILVADKHDLNKKLDTAKIKSKLAILIDFGIIVSQKVIDYFPLGIVNSHFSILPEWRGADPITYALLSGQEKTGVSLMLIVEKMDEGDLISYGEYKMDPDITNDQLSDILIDLSYTLLKDAVPKYIAKEISPFPQSATKRKISYSRKLTKADGTLDFEKPAIDLEREIRAFNEWPKSRTKLGKLDVIITKAKVINESDIIGKINVNKDSLVIHCSKGALSVERLKPAGKNEMDIKQFLAGYTELITE